MGSQWSDLMKWNVIVNEDAKWKMGWDLCKVYFGTFVDRITRTVWQAGWAVGAGSAARVFTARDGSVNQPALKQAWISLKTRLTLKYIFFQWLVSFMLL